MPLSLGIQRLFLYTDSVTNRADIAISISLCTKAKWRLCILYNNLSLKNKFEPIIWDIRFLLFPQA